VSALAQLVDGLVDYAGLFPPAGLEMRGAVREYVETRNGADAWRVGRFVLPVSRLHECATTAKILERSMEVPSIELSAVAGGDVDADLRTVWEYQALQLPARVCAVEVRLDSPTEVARVAELGPPGIELFVEIPLSDRLEELISAIGAAGAKAKVRTGGVTEDAFPDPPRIVRFIRACLDSGVAFKATAGLHHPMRGRYRLTYAASSPEAWMNGYVNLFLVAAYMQHREMSDVDALALLSETDAGSLCVQPETAAQPSTITWNGHSVTAGDLMVTRTRLALTFGSCSIREPVDELAALGLRA
jgi:hypothetical protein